MLLAALLSRKDFTLQFQVLRTWVTRGGDSLLLVVSSPPRFPSHSGGAGGEEPSCQCKRNKRHGVDPWVGKSPWRRVWYSSILAWRIPWTEKPGGLQSVGSQRVGHDWSDLAHSMHQEDFTTSPEGRKELSFFYGILWITAGMDTLNSIDLAEISTFLFSAFRDLECLDLN